MNKHVLILVAMATVVFSANFWGTSVYILDEAKNAGCAMEMYHRDDWVVPTFNNELRTDKPPLHYYFMRAAYTVFNVNAFSARVFSVVMGILTVLSVYFFTAKLINPQAGFLSGLILACSIQLAIQFHLAVPDPYLIFFLTTGLLSFSYAFITDRSVFYYIFYGCIGLATLAKGPVAPVFAGLTILIFLLVQRKLGIPQLLAIKLLPGALLFLAVVVPWYVWVGIETKGVWLEQFFFKHNVGRFTSTMEGHRGFPLLSVVIIIAALIPFSVFFPQAFKMVWRELRQSAFVCFCFVAMAVIVIFFAFSRTILPSYPEPSVPFFAILLGFFFARVASDENVKRFKLPVNAIIYLVIALLLPVATALAIRQEKDISEAWPVVYYMVTLPITAAVALYFLLRKNVLAAVYSYSAGAVLFLITFFYCMFPVVDRLNPVTQSLPQLQHIEEPIVYYKDFNPAFVFALRHPVPGFIDPEALRQFTSQHPTLYILTQKRYWEELPANKELLYQGKDLFERQETILVKLK